MSLFDFFLITFCVLVVAFLIFLWRRGAIDKGKATEAMQDFADDSRRQRLEQRESRGRCGAVHGVREDHEIGRAHV